MQMNVLSKVLPPAIASLVILLAGCATPYQPAVVTKASIQNTSVGYKGYTLEIPPGFKAGQTQKTGQDVPLWADVDAALVNGQLKQELGIKFSESFFIYNSNVVILFVMMVVDTREGTLSMLDDRQANRLLLSGINTLFKKNPKTTSVKTELINENKHRGVYASGIFRPNRQEERSFQVYDIMGEMDELYTIVGMSDPKDKEELTVVTRQLYYGLKF